MDDIGEPCAYLFVHDSHGIVRGEPLFFIRRLQRLRSIGEPIRRNRARGVANEGVVDQYFTRVYLQRIHLAFDRHGDSSASARVRTCNDVRSY